MRKLFLVALVILLCLILPVFRAVGQTSDEPMDISGPSHSAQEMPGMPGMDTHNTSTEKMNMQPKSLIESRLQHATSGTDAEPNSTPTEMLMTTKGSWTLMFHGEGFLIETQQSGPRGYDKLFSTNWWMPMAQRKFGKGTLTLRTMLSFEPATVSKRFYPELFQQGETAFGRPIVDGQHPHDFFMELAALYDYKSGGAYVVVGIRRAHGRSGDGAAGVSASGVGVGRSHRAAGTSSSGLHAHCGRCRHPGHHPS